MIKSNYTTALAAGLVSVLSIGAVLPSGAQHGPRDYQRTALTAIKEGSGRRPWMPWIAASAFMNPVSRCWGWMTASAGSITRRASVWPS